MKCEWCKDGGLLEKYHDTEWGIPCHNDKLLFEYLMLECLSAGLSWMLMLKKRDIFHACFADFDYEKIADFTDEDVERIMQYSGMIRSRSKIEAIISNARLYIKIREEWGSFDKYLWRYTDGQTIIYQRLLDGEWLTTSDLSDEIAKDLKKLGFKFLGSTLIYSYLQAVGIINAHMTYCDMFEKIGGKVI